MKRTTLSERALVVAPRGRDAAIAVGMLAEAGIGANACASLPELIEELDRGAGVVVITEESLVTTDLTPLAAWIADQEEWSDLPFVLLTSHGAGLERNPAARRYLDVLGNVTFIERPFHPTTLVSLVQSALRARRRQYEARARLQALRESEARFQAIANSVDQMIWSARPDGYHDYYNQRWYDYTGVPEGSTDGEGWNGMFHPDDQQQAWSRWRHSLATGEPYHIEYRLRHRSGHYRWVLGRAQCVRDEQGRITRWYGTCTDVQDIVHAREVLARSQEELGNLVAARTADLMKTEDALRQAQKMEAIGQLTGGVAHDFNNLLTIIRSSTDLLRRADLDEERRGRYVEAIADTVERASKLTGQLLAFARRQALKPEVFDAAERVRDLTEMLRTMVGSRIRIVTEIVDQACCVEADVSQFETAIVNMAVNARDAMEGEGTLTITVEGASEKPPIRAHAGAPGPFVAVSLSDTGSGIAPEKLAHIFEPFFTTKEVGKGTGLGLSQVYGFAKQSGGDVAAESKPGSGARFTLYLPRVEAAAFVEETDERRPAQEDTGGGRRVLVVEDNANVGSFSTQVLRDLGYETTWAANGGEALAVLAETANFDVVFSDVVMPGMSGIDLAEEIRRRYPGLPVVLTSGYSHVLAQEGGHGFELLRKPYAMEDLSRLLRRVTRAASRLATTP